MMLRVREVEPPPQLSVQVPQPPHWLGTQCSAHGVVLQLRESSRAGHIRPPHTFDVVIVRVRTCVPVLQPAVHVDQPDHTETAQLTSALPLSGQGGHVCALHDPVSDTCSQALPP